MEQGRNGHKMVYLANIDVLSHIFSEYNGSPTEAQVKSFSRKCKNWGLEDYEVDILVAKFVYGKTDYAIYKEQGWSSRKTVNNYYNRALDKLVAKWSQSKNRRVTS